MLPACCLGVAGSLACKLGRNGVNISYDRHLFIENPGDISIESLLPFDFEAEGGVDVLGWAGCGVLGYVL